MNRSLRVTAGVFAASAGLLAAGITAGATVNPHKTDPILAADLSVSNVSPQLNIGGSSFDGPLVQAAQGQWNTYTKKAPIALYAITKSGTGRADMLNGTYNIGFSDFPLNQAGNTDVGPNSPYPTLTTADFVQVPVVLGGVATVFHFGTGISGTEAGLINKYGLTFSGKVLAEIFAGKITNWDSPAIGATNHDLYVGGKDVLPNLAIAVLSRTSGSGTTFGFTDYLSDVDPKDFPAPTSAAFPAAAATYANSGLLDAAVDSTNGAIGYVEYGYAVANGTPNANLINASGKVVKLSEKGIAEAATVGLAYIQKHGGFNTTTLSHFEINNEKGTTVWPIALFSYAMMYKTQTNKADATAEVKFLDYLVHTDKPNGPAGKLFGQDLADANGYVALPALMQTISRGLLLEVKVGGKVVL